MLLNSSKVSPIQIFIYATDQALLKALFFAGDRAADLLQGVGCSLIPDNSVFLFNHIWTKTSRSGDANVFASKRGPNRLICPVRGLEMYFNISGSLGVQLAPGFLFCPSNQVRFCQSSFSRIYCCPVKVKLYTSSCSGRLSS